MCWACSQLVGASPRSRQGVRHDRARERQVERRGRRRQQRGPFISANGRYVGFESSATNLVQGDTNGQPDVFLHDMVTGKTSRVSVRSHGAEANGASVEPFLSTNGQYIAFTSSATNLGEPTRTWPSSRTVTR